MCMKCTYVLKKIIGSNQTILSGLITKSKMRRMFNTNMQIWFNCLRKLYFRWNKKGFNTICLTEIWSKRMVAGLKKKSLLQYISITFFSSLHSSGSIIRKTQRHGYIVNDQDINKFKNLNISFFKNISKFLCLSSGPNRHFAVVLLLTEGKISLVAIPFWKVKIITVIIIEDGKMALWAYLALVCMCKQCREFFENLKTNCYRRSIQSHIENIIYIELDGIYIVKGVL